MTKSLTVWGMSVILFWVDKGLKGLIANGRNDDGTLKNVEYETPFLMRTMSRNGDWELIYDPIGTDYNSKIRTFGNDVYLDKHTNQWVNLGTGIMQTKLYTNLAKCANVFGKCY